MGDLFPADFVAKPSGTADLVEYQTLALRVELMLAMLTSVITRRLMRRP
jgi:hypothetical protein